MAWRVNAGMLNSGETVTWSFFWPNNAYQGIQVIQARPIPDRAGSITFTGTALFEVSTPGLQLELNGGYTYSITVTNKGPWASQYELVGTAV